LEISVACCDDSAEPGYGQADTPFVLLGILLDQRVDQRGRRRDDAHVLVVEEVDDPRGPLATGDHLLASAEQS